MIQRTLRAAPPGTKEALGATERHMEKSLSHFAHSLFDMA